MLPADALVVGSGDVVVASENTLVGVVSAAALDAAAPDADLGGLAQEKSLLRPDKDNTEERDLVDDTDSTTIPVVVGSGRLIGVYRAGTPEPASFAWG